MPKTVVLCSGGLNSAVIAALARQDSSLCLLHVRLGHRAAPREEKCFTALAQHWQDAERLIVDLPTFAAIGGNPRMDASSPADVFSVTGDSLTHTHVPGMVGALLSVAASWASQIGARQVMLGVSENLGEPAPRTASFWPDYAREYSFLWGQLYSIGTAGDALRLETPLLEMTRGDIIKLGHRLSVPFEHTWSCLAGGEAACGQCSGCVTRARGFLEAAIPDPLTVEASAVKAA